MSGVISRTSSSPSSNGLIFAGWNQDHGCFACGMESGFRIYNADPLKEKERQDFDDGGLRYVEMLFRCNYLALIGGGPKPKFPSDHVIVWDDLKKKPVVDLTFESEVKSVKLRRDRIVAVLQNSIRVYNFTQSPRELRRIDTGDNPKGLCALCPNSNNSILAYPAKSTGHVGLVDLVDMESSPMVISAHETGIACLALNLQGTRLATSSEKGTLIRIFDTSTSDQLTELRRGTSNAIIYCMSFNADSSLLCAASDHATVHVFDVNLAQKSGGKGWFPGKQAPKSFQRFNVSQNSQCICAFGSDKNSVVGEFGMQCVV